MHAKQAVIDQFLLKSGTLTTSPTCPSWWRASSGWPSQTRWCAAPPSRASTSSPASRDYMKGAEVHVSEPIGARAGYDEKHPKIMMSKVWHIRICSHYSGKF